MEQAITKKGLLRANEKADGFIELSHPLDFICIVRRNQLVARVIGYLKHPIYRIYKVAFSDGYVSEFDNSRGDWFDAASKQTGSFSLYAFSIKHDLSSLIGFEHCKEYYYFRTKADDEERNVFVLLREHEGIEMYDVRYNGFYFFSLVKTNDEWQYGNVYHRDEPLDEVLARNISLLIEANHH